MSFRHEAQDPVAQTSIMIRPPADHARGRAVLQAALDRFDKVTLSPGTVWHVDGPVFLRDRDWLTTDLKRPATIRRTGDTRQVLVFNGHAARISNLQLDWNFGGEWRQFCTLVTFDPPYWLPEGVRQCGGNQVSHVEFIASTSMGRRSRENSGDCWCISWAHRCPGIIEDTAITFCRSLTPGVQLTGNGSGRGFRRLLIRDNEVWGGSAAAIALSSLNAATDGQTIFDQVTIERNVIREARHYGIFVGQDGSTPADVTTTGLIIRDNHIEMAALPVIPGKPMEEYQHAILLRGGQTDGCELSATVESNLIDLRNCVGRAPRGLICVPAKSLNKLDVLHNRAFGPPAEWQAPTLAPGELQQSGNLQLDEAGNATDLKIAA